MSDGMLIVRDVADSAGVVDIGEARSYSEMYILVQYIVITILCFVFTCVFLGRIVGVDGSSMFPTLEDGDMVVMSNLFYTPEIGDIVIFTKESFKEEPLVKRVIAMEGQIVDINPGTGDVIVDGKVLEEDYISELTWVLYDVVFPITVPEGAVFVMGDNRNASTDSRSKLLGMVDIRCVLGKVYAVLPGNGGIRPA